MPSTTLESTVSDGNSQECWNTTPRLGLESVTACPSTITKPEDGCSNPASRFSAVELPQPVGPTIETISLGAMSRLKSPSANVVAVRVRWSS